MNAIPSPGVASRSGSCTCLVLFFFSSRRRHTRLQGYWSSDVCSSDLLSPGGGGFGDPRTRDPARVLRDVRDGVVSAVTAERDYAVAIAEDGRSINETRTAALRAAAQ